MKLYVISFSLLFILQSLSAQDQGEAYNQWEEILKNKKGTITLYWHTSEPFVFRDADGKMNGIEFEIIKEFINYVNKAYQVELKVTWKETAAFKDIIPSVEQSLDMATFGSSAFSITKERQQLVGFSPPYLPDIAVLISNKEIPIVTNVNEFKHYFNDLSALTIKNTSYESDLIKIKQELEMDFAINYIPSNKNILRSVANNKNTFGFIDLPVYLLEFNKNPSLNIKRQQLFPIKRVGYAFIYPKSSDWQYVMEEFFINARFREKIREIVSKYLDYEIFNFIQDLHLNADNELILLTKEKELQQQELERKEYQILRESRFRTLLVAALIIIIILFIMMYRQYHKRFKTLRIIGLQKEKIEEQRINMAHQSRILEDRNKELVLLNQEKNKLLRILAHDMRTPINQISGLATLFLLENKKLNKEGKYIMDEIHNATKRLTEMISKILDVDAIDINEINIIKKDIVLNQLCTNIHRNFKKTANAKSIELSLSMPEEELKLKTDPMYLQQIIENLLSNAIKFSKANTTVKFTIEKKSDKCIIAVEDQGPGLSEDDKKAIFKNYQRLSAQPTAGESSTGLGLSIVKKYTQILGGSIDFESEEGQGTTFLIAFDCL